MPADEEPIRTLIMIRLSHLTDETTSPERQREICESWCVDHGRTIVDVAEDLDVSARTTSPFERPALRKWLDRPQEYDEIVFWRFDRIIRRIRHLSKLMDWAEDHDVNLVSATESYFDMSTPFGQIIAYVIAICAEMEAEATAQRTTETYIYNLRLGKYRGGAPSAGYIPQPDGEGNWELVPYPPTQGLILEAADRILNKKELPGQIVKSFNERGELTFLDHFRVARGEEARGAKWRTSNLLNVLRSPTLLGQIVYRPVISVKKGKKTYGDPQILRNDDGTPVVRAEPIISRFVFDQLDTRLEKVARARGPYKSSNSLLLRVIKCKRCELPAYLIKKSNRELGHYRCGSSAYGEPCGNGHIANTVADDFVSNALMSIVGDVERTEKIYVPGEDPAKELEEIDAELTDVAGLIGTGAFKTGPAREKLETRASALAKRREVLANTPARKSGYEYRPTGQTFRAYWDSLDMQGRNMFLRNHNVQVFYNCARGEDPDIDLSFGDLPDLVSAIDPSAGEVFRTKMDA